MLTTCSLFNMLFYLSPLALTQILLLVRSPRRCKVIACSTHCSCCWIWCSCRGSTGWLFPFSYVLRSHDSDAYAACQRQNCCLPRSMYLFAACGAVTSSRLPTPKPSREGILIKQGGYNLQSISKSALAVTRTLMGEPPGRLKNVTASTSAIATVRKVAAFQSKYWPCIIMKDIDQGPQVSFKHEWPG